MKLDVTVMRTMERADFRVLEAVERGMRRVVESAAGPITEVEVEVEADES